MTLTEGSSSLGQHLLLGRRVRKVQTLRPGWQQAPSKNSGGGWAVTEGVKQGGARDPA